MTGTKSKNNFIFLSASLCAVFVCGFFAPVHAQVIASDDFVTASTVKGLSIYAKTGWAGPWTGSARLLNDGLGLRQLPAVGGRMQTQGQGLSVFRQLAAPRNTVNTRTWITFLANVPSGTIGSRYAGLSLFDGDSEQLFLGLTNGANRYGFAPFADPPVEDRHTTVMADGTTRLFVCLLDGHDATTDIYLWIDPIGDAEPTSATAEASLVGVRRNFTVDRIRISSGEDIVFNVAALRIGVRYGDVTFRRTNILPVPETSNQQARPTFASKRIDTSHLSPEKIREFNGAVSSSDVGKVRQMLHSDPAYASAIVPNTPGGETPLFAAVDMRNEYSAIIADMLLSNGADINARTSEGLTPLSYVKDDKALLLYMLQHGANPDVQSEYSHGPLVSDWLEDEQVTRLLVQKGVNLNRRDEEGNTPLHRIIGFGKAPAIERKARLIELLVNHGANVNAQNNEGFTPLHNAANLAPANHDILSIQTYDPVDLARTLLKMGADVRVQTKEGFTPVHVVIDSYIPHLGILRALLQKGASPDARDSKGRTPLHIAAEKGRLECAKILLEFQTDINAEDADGRRPLQYALGSNSDSNPNSVVAFLRKLGAKL